MADDERPADRAERVVLDARDAAAHPELARLGELLRSGGLVAFPTETVYGLGANALDPRAVARVFAAKRRPSFNPLIVHVASREDVSRVVTAFPPAAERLADAFWPGPLTLVLPRAPAIPDVVTGGLDTVGVRMPAHPVARALIAAAGVPLAAPSANEFTRISPTTAGHVLDQLGDRVDAVVDGGPTTVGIESTVVAVDGDRVTLLRPGGVTRAALEQVVGAIATAADETGDAVRPSPGRIERHYAPRARLVATTRGPDGALLLPDVPDAPFAVVSRGPTGHDLPAHADPIELPDDAAGYARLLYAALHRLDAGAATVAFVEAPPGTGDWEAVRDRLRRAGLR